MKPRAVFLFCVTILFLLTPLMLPGFNGYDPEDFPVQIARPLVQPAGYAFSIWLIIYGGLLAHAGYGLIARFDHPGWDRNRLALIAALVLGTLWVAFAEDQPVIATGVILLMAVAALIAVFQTGRSDGVWQLPPIALFAGWVTAAAGVATGITLSGLGWLPDQTAALLALAAVLLVAVLLQLRLRALPYGAAVTWALIGIVVANWGQNTPVTAAALGGAFVMAALVWKSRQA